MNHIELLLIAVGVAMDAFSVAICVGAVWRALDRRGAWRLALHFGFFQFLMPVLGYYSAVSFRDYITEYDHWLAFFLLLYLGINMIREANEACHVKKDYSVKEMAVLAIATSIDALAVGISLAFLNTDIWSASILIGVVTFAIAAFGGLAGFKLGAMAGKRADVVGGLVLIFIGVKILLEHTGII